MQPAFDRGQLDLGLGNGINLSAILITKYLGDCFLFQHYFDNEAGYDLTSEIDSIRRVWQLTCGNLLFRSPWIVIQFLGNHLNNLSLKKKRPFFSFFFSLKCRCGFSLSCSRCAPSAGLSVTVKHTHECKMRRKTAAPLSDHITLDKPICYCPLGSVVQLT